MDSKPQQQTDNAPRLFSVKEFCKRHAGWCTESSLRWLIFNAEQNGYDRAFKRLQRKVLIDEVAFFAVLEAQNTTGVAAHRVSPSDAL